jgi:predicted Zn-dependent protease
MTSVSSPCRPARRRWPWLVLAVLALAGVAAGGAWLWARHHWQAAREALRHHRLAEADTHLDRCRMVWRRDPEVLFLAARVARRRDDLDRARQLLDACETQPGITPALALERTLLQVQQGQLRNYEADLHSAVKQGNPDAPDILEALAKGYMNAHSPDQTIDALDFLLEQEPDHVPALVLRGRFWENQRRDDEAERDYRRAVELAPDWPAARLYLADCLARLGEVRQAVAHYEYLRARPPVAPGVVLGLARCRHDLHELDEAERLLQGLLAERPDGAAAVAEWGRVLVRRGRAAEAEPRLRDAAARAPHDHDVRLVLTLCLEVQGKSEEAAQSRARLHAIEEDLLRLVVLRARLSQGSPNDVRLRYEIGTILLRTGQETEGLRWLAGVLDIDPVHAATHRILADHYERGGNSEAAAHHRRLGARSSAQPAP